MGDVTARVRASTQDRTADKAPEAQAPAGAVRPLARAPRALSGDALGRALEQAFDADFSDVQVHEGSSLAAGMGATAFARGSEIHLAPGAPAPGTRAGDRLLAHELAHVVQQREGLARPTARTATGDLADPSPALEADADAQADRAVRGLDARPPAPRSAAPAAAHAEPVVQGSFVASAKLSPVAGTDAPIGLGGLHVASVEITNKKRPPTRLEGSQGRHTVAWQAKVVYWKKLFSNASATDIVTRLATLAESDEQADIAAGDEGVAGRTERAPLLRWLAEARKATFTATSADLVEQLEQALTLYAKAYQKGSFTAFASTNPVGKNEAGHLATLDAAQGGFALDDATLATAARGLVDLPGHIVGPRRVKIAQDAVAMLDTLYPTVTARLRVAAGTQDLVTALFATDATPGPGAALVPVLDDQQADGVNIPGLEPFLIRLSARPTDAHARTYAPEALEVDRVQISDERPPTRFGIAQMSHTIPWSLERLAWSKAFSGGTLREVLDELLGRVEAEATWSTAGTSASLRDRRARLAAELDRLRGVAETLPAWTAKLDECIEEYVALYQLAPFSTFGTEATASGDSTARGRGEASALTFMHAAEATLGQTPPGAIDLGQVQAKAAALVDAPQLDSNRALVDVPRLRTRWLAEMESLFPRVMAAAGDQVRAGFDATATQTAHGRELSALISRPRETRAGAKRRLDPKKAVKSGRVTKPKTGARKAATVKVKGKDVARAEKYLKKRRG